jgi:site-specific DNA recombinase
MKFVSEYEDEFVRQVMERGTAEHLKQTSSLKKTIDTAKRRIEQIDSVISQLYEDKVVGEITSEMFTKLSAKYIAEQEEQSTSFKVAQKELVALEAKKTDTTKFIDLVRKYSQITELTPQILNEFIDKVTVHQAFKVDGKRRQDIEVYFNGVGLISSDAEKKPETTE